MVLFLIALNVALVVVVFVVRKPADEQTGFGDSDNRTALVPLESPPATTARTVHPTTLLLTRALDPDERVSASAAAAIAREPLQHPAALTGMIAMVKTAPPRARLSGLWAVRSLLRARPECCVLCWRDPLPEVRAAVVASVKREDQPAAPAVGGRLASVEIVESASADENPLVRRAAYAALHVLGRDRGRPAIWRGLDDADPEVVRLACARLAEIVDAASIRQLVEYMATAKRENVRCVLQAVARVDAPIIDPLMELALRGARLKVRVAAVRAIGVAGVPAVCLGLAPLLHDGRAEVRRAAAAAVADIARIAAGHGIHADVVHHLGVQLQQEQEPRVLLALLDALESCRAAAALPAIRRKLPDVGPALRERGLEAIAAIEGHDDVGTMSAGRVS